MDIKIELEVKAKAFEIYKKILNKNNTTILFNGIVNDSIIESVTVKNRTHEFKVVKKNIDKEVSIINKKFHRLIPQKILSLPNMKQKVVEINKLKYLKVFKLFLGNIFTTKDSKELVYRFNYNGVTYPIKQQEYNKLYFYSEYAYKIYQLRKLNKEMGIEQNITLYFDEDVLSTNMYSKIYNIIKDIL